MTAVIDLGKKKTVRHLSASLLHDINAWIFRPEEVEFLISEDGKNFKSIARISSPLPLNDSNKQPILYSTSIKPLKARYVKVQARNIGICPEWHKGTGGKAWLFADEIIVE